MSKSSNRSTSITFIAGEELARKLQYETDVSGVPKAEILRRALEGYLKYLDHKRKKEQGEKEQIEIWDL